MILIINKSKKQASVISDMFHFMGVLSRAATPAEALSEISDIYRAVLVVKPDEIYDERDFTDRLRTCAPHIPIFALGTCRHKDVFDAEFPENLSAAKIFSGINHYTSENGMKKPGNYLLAGIDASVNLTASMYFFTVLPFTKTETMIVRALTRFYPEPLSAEKILKYAFRGSRTPEPSSVRTHISTINKKFRKISGRNLIQMYDGKGYIVLTTENSELFTASAT